MCAWGCSQECVCVHMCTRMRACPRLILDICVSHSLSERSPRVEWCEANSGCLWKNKASLVTAVSSKHTVVLGLWLCVLPGVAEGVSWLQTVHCSWLLLFVYTTLWEKTRFCYVQLVLVTIQLELMRTPLGWPFLTSEEEFSSNAWNKIGFMEDFSPLNLLAPFSQVPPPLEGWTNRYLRYWSRVTWTSSLSFRPV